MDNNEKLIVACDFDGTCVQHTYPRIGQDIGAVPVLKKLVDNGHKLILFTMRGDSVLSNNKGLNGEPVSVLKDAVNWFERNGIPLYGVQLNPTQRNWTSSNKCYANLYIDDAALGCPLLQDYYYKMDDYGKQNKIFTGRPYVDWVKVEEILIEKGLIRPKIEENV